MFPFGTFLPVNFSHFFYVFLFGQLLNYAYVVYGAFQETPASFLGEINSRVVLRCTYYQEIDRLMSGPIRIRIDWLKAEPQLADTSASLPPPFEPFFEDKRRIFIKYQREEFENLVKNTSIIEIVEAKYEDMGRYKCVVNGGNTYGGDESPEAQIKLS